jgi:hypothetical protein
MTQAHPDERRVAMLRAVLIATCVTVTMPCFADQVRVINGDIEHVYGAGGQLLDDADLQARNQRASEHMRAEKQLAIERRQVEIDMQRLKLQEAALATGTQNWDYGMAPDWDLSDGGWFIGPSRGFAPRRGISRRIGISPRAGISRRR